MLNMRIFICFSVMVLVLFFLSFVVRSTEFTLYTSGYNIPPAVLAAYEEINDTQQKGIWFCLAQKPKTTTMKHWEIRWYEVKEGGTSTKGYDSEGHFMFYKSYTRSLISGALQYPPVCRQVL